MLLGTVPKASKSQWTHCTSLHCQPLSICPAFFAQKRPQHRKVQENPPTRVGVLSSLILCSIQNLVQNPKSEIQNPKSSPKIQNSDHRGPHKKNCYITIQNPKSKIPKSGQKSLDFGFWIRILDSGFWILGGSRGSPLVRQLYLIGLGEERKLGNRDERGREPKPPLWAIYFRGFAAVGLNKGHNQPYLIRLGEDKKLGKRDERGREQKRVSWAISSGVLLQLELKKDMNVQQIVGQNQCYGLPFSGACCSWT